MSTTDTIDPWPMAHWYQCPNCKTTMHTPWKAPYGQPYRCIGSGQSCFSIMRYLYYDTCPPEEAGQIVWNPGLRRAGGLRRD